MESYLGIYLSQMDHHGLANSGLIFVVASNSFDLVCNSSHLDGLK